MSRIATVAPISEAEATGKVAEIYADIRATKKILQAERFARRLASRLNERLFCRIRVVPHR